MNKNPIATHAYTAEETKYGRLLDERFARLNVGEPPWNAWRARAISAGVSEKLALLGCTVMRTFFDHGWDNPLAAECGHADDGVALLALALTAPEVATHRWQQLIETDGLRGEWTPDGWHAWSDIECARAILELFPNGGLRRQ